MAIVINANPGLYYSVHGDLIFVVYEATKANDPVTYPDYKYVADIYVGTTQVARIKKVPQPDNKRGVFNIGDIVRNYMLATFNPQASVLRAQEMALQEFFLDVTVKFGEEYGFTLYTNLTVDSERVYFNHYNGRMLGMNTVLTPYLDLVVSTRPYAEEVNFADNFTFIPYLPSSTDPFDVVITKYGSGGTGTTDIEWGYSDTDPYSTVDTETLQFSGSFIPGTNSLPLNFTSAGTLKYLTVKQPISEPIMTQWQNTILNYGTIPDSVFRAPVTIGGFRYYVSRNIVVLDSTNYTITFSNGMPPVGGGAVTGVITETITPSVAFALQILNVSPGEINTLSPGFIDSSALYYTVQIGAISIYRFNLICEPRFQTYKVHFMNKFGGFETKNFGKLSRKSIAITKSAFGKLPYTIDGSGNVVYWNANNVYNETQSTYASQYTEKMTLNSDNLTDAEYVWLSDLMLSPLVYLEMNGYFVSMQIVATDYEIKKAVNDKLTNLTIEVEFGDQFSAQYR